MTKRECAIVMAYTGAVMLQGDDLGIFYGYIYEILGHSIYTHELGAYIDEIKERSRKDFLELCRSAE